MERGQLENRVVPWISGKIQRWLLIAAGPFWALCAIVAIFLYAGGVEGMTYLIGAILYGAMATVAIYAGIKTKWLKNVGEAPTSARLAGGVAIVGTGVYFLVTAAIVSLMLMAIVFAIIVGMILASAVATGVFSSGFGGETIEDFFGGKTFYDEHGRPYKIEKGWFGKTTVWDSHGNKIAELRKNMWGDSVTILDDSGDKVGEITKGTFGQKQIVDKLGRKVGNVDADFWGNIVIRKSK